MMAEEQHECVGCDDKTCASHSGNNERIHQLEEKMAVVENNTATVAKLTARVNLLLLLISFGTTGVIGGAVYTFTGLSRFKDIYAADRITLQQQLNAMQKANIESLNTGLKELNAGLNTKIDNLDHKVDSRMDQISERITKLEGAVDNFRGGWPPPQNDRFPSSDDPE